MSQGIALLRMSRIIPRGGFGNGYRYHFLPRSRFALALFTFFYSIAPHNYYIGRAIERGAKHRAGY